MISLPRVLAVAKRIVLQFRRDRRTLVMMVAAPILVLSLLAFLIRLHSSAPIAVVNEDAGLQGVAGGISLSRLMIADLQANKDLRLIETSRGDATSRLKGDKDDAVLLFPEDFSQALRASGQARLLVTVEGTNPQTSARALGALQRALAQSLVKLRNVADPTAPAAEPLKLELSYIYGSAKFAPLDFFGPVLISLYAFLFVYLLTSVSFLRERAQGTMERLLASPLSRTEIVLGYMLGFSVFAMLQSTVALLYAVYVLRINYVGNLLIVFIVVIVLTLGSANLGIALSAFARNELQAMQFIPVILTPQIVLSGAFWAVKDLPAWLRVFSYVMPLTYSNNALRDVMIRGFGLTSGAVALNVLVLLGFVAFFAMLGAITLQREVA